MALDFQQCGMCDQQSLRSEPLLVACIFYECLVLTEQHLEILSLKGGCSGTSKSTLVKIPHCWKSHVMAQLLLMPVLGIHGESKDIFSIASYTGLDKQKF